MKKSSSSKKKKKRDGEQSLGRCRSCVKHMKLQAEQWWQWWGWRGGWRFRPEFTPFERGKEKEEGEKAQKKSAMESSFAMTEASDGLREGNWRWTPEQAKRPTD